MRAKLPSLEECRRLKKWDRSEFWEHPQEPPWFFGCPDYCHDETGAVNWWLPNPPEYKVEDYKPPEPREKQLYPGNQLERSRWDNDQVGWSKMVDLGIKNDYWRHYDEWN